MSSPDTLVIRRAEDRDVPDLGRLGATLMRLHHGFDRQRFMTPPADAESGYAWFLRSQLGTDDSLVLVAEKAGAVVGYCYAALEPLSWKDLRDAAGFIHDILVDEPLRGGHIGQALMDEAVRWLREKGMPRVVLFTAEGNPDARRLFARLGFRPTMIEMTRELATEE